MVCGFLATESINKPDFVYCGHISDGLWLMDINTKTDLTEQGYYLPKQRGRTSLFFFLGERYQVALDLNPLAFKMDLLEVNLL